MRLQKKILFQVLIITSTMLGLSAIYEARQQKAELEELIIDFHTTLLKNSLGSFSNGLWNLDTISIEAAVNGLFVSDTVYQVQVFDDQGDLFLGKKRSQKDDEKIEPLKSPVDVNKSLENKNSTDLISLDLSVNEHRIIGVLTHRDNGTDQFLGHVVMDYSSLEILRLASNSFMRLIISGCIAVLGLSGLLYFFMRKSVIYPITELAKATKEIAKGNLNVGIKHSTNDEVGQLASDFELMREQVKSFTSDLQHMVEEKSEKIAAQQQQLVQSSKLSSLGEMAGGVAHEINNPLAVILAQTSVLKREWGKNQVHSPQSIESVNGIISMVDRIAKIINGLRSFSRDASKDPMEEVLISKVIEDTILFCKERFNSHSIELRINMKADQATCIMGRSTELSQVLINLLNNAHDAVEPLDQKWVELKTETDFNKLIISVTDSGTGIPERIADKMMQPFFTTKELGKGTGLGLSISKGIVEAHGGVLYYDRSSKHTRFTMELPLAVKRS